MPYKDLQKRKEYQKTYNAKNKQRNKELKEKWYLENRESILLRETQKYIENKEKKKQYGREYYFKNSEKARIKRQENKNEKRERDLKVKYNMSSKQYEEILKKQDNKCKICETKQENLKRKLSIDHCHKTKKIRGLLCDNCNHGLGAFKDNLNFLQKAIQYLIKE